MAAREFAEIWGEQMHAARHLRVVTGALSLVILVAPAGAGELVEAVQALYPALRACSFDRGFHSPDNRVRLDALLDVNALPGKGSSTGAASAGRSAGLTAG